MYKTVIIDDDPNLLEGMRHAIPWHELNMEWVGEGLDGKQGLDLIMRKNPEIVICDIDMPVMNGLEMIETLRNNNYKGKIVILSGYSDFEYARKALRLSVQDYLNKPITVESLKEVLNQVTKSLAEEQEEQYARERSEVERVLSLDYALNEWLKSLMLRDYVDDILSLEGMKNKISQWENESHMVLGIQFECMEVQVVDDTATCDTIPVPSIIREEISSILNTASILHDYVVINSRQHALFLHFPQPLSDGTKEMKAVQQVSLEIENRLFELWKLRINIGMGSIQNNWRNTHASFEQAFSSILSGTGYSEVHHAGTLRSIRFYHQLAQAIRNVHENRIYKLIEEHIEALSKHTLIHVTEMSRFRQELQAILSYTLYDNGIEMQLLRLPEIPDPDVEFFYSCNLLRSWLNEVVREILSKMNGDNNPRHRKIVEMIKQYTDQHYMDDLTLGFMADYVQVSRNYLGQIFKNVMGETFNSYLTRVRMEKAKEMLISGNLYIYEVAERVGYHSISYFSTQFKKYMGQNPTDLH